MFTVQREREVRTVKIRWYEVLILALTALCALILLIAYFSAAGASGTTVVVERVGAAQMR